MSNVVYFVASSLDGYIADSTGSLDWLTSIENAPDELSARFMESVGVQVMGSTTFEWLCTHENLIAEPEKWETYFHGMKTIVFSNGTPELPESAEIMVVSGSVAEHLELMQELAGEKDIWLVGGGKLASQFLDAGLLNRVEITYAPVVLGSGTELFDSPQYTTSLKLITAETVGNFTHLCFEVPAN